MKLSTETLTLILLALTPAFTLAIPPSEYNDIKDFQKAGEIICIPSTNNCYPREFQPTIDWQIIQEGQIIPAGLDIQMDWQTGEKRARLPDGVESVEELNRIVDEMRSTQNEDDGSKGLQLVEEDESKKVVSYNNEEEAEEEDAEEEEEEALMQLKQAATGSASVIDISEALAFLRLGNFQNVNEKKLLIALESLNEYSHSLKDGLRITLPENLEPLLQLGLTSGGNYHEMELSLRIIAQSLRHNLKALGNVNSGEVLGKVLRALDTETNSVIQKRLLGVVSAVLQTKENVLQFIQMDGVKTLLKDFSRLQEDSKIRTLAILEDVETLQNSLQKRAETEDLDLTLYQTLEESLMSNSYTNQDNLMTTFTKLSQLKQSHPEWKPTSSKFLQWLVKDIERQALQKRNNDQDYYESLHQKMKEDRHLVFGNPNALRKAFDDEL